MDYYRVIQADIRGHFEIILYKAYIPFFFYVHQLCNYVSHCVNQYLVDEKDHPVCLLSE